MSTKKIITVLTNLFVLGAVVLAGGFAWYLHAQSLSSNEQTIALLVPDGYDVAGIDLWTQAAAEEGVRLELLTASTFLRPLDFGKKNYAGILIPDGVHQRGNNLLIERLKQYVRDGGKLMLVFDALTQDLNGIYSTGKSRLSELAGVDYALYSLRRDQTIAHKAVGGTFSAMQRIGITPGRYSVENPMRYGERRFDHWFTTYHYGTIDYPFFVTGPVTAPDNVLLLGADGSAAAIENMVGSGKVLFVNLPLGLLKNRTDGLLLHTFLRYFSDDIVGLPRLLSAPNGIGGMVLNIHTDSDEGLSNLTFMNRIGVFNQGPYSVHFTAGPDVDHAGDGMGTNINHNPVAQAWIRNLTAGGHAIGNHGGWIHNDFGNNLTEKNQADYEPYLVMNDDAIKKVINKPILEYSAPNGNHPAWVTDWLVQKKVLAFYTTANNGAGPTRPIDRDGVVDRRIWSIPVTPFGRIASFEEAMFSGLSKKAITGWLNAVSNYVADNKNIRLIYCHPLGVRFYAESVNAWLKTTKALSKNNLFKWYTMTDVAQFMSRRELTSWSFKNQDGEMVLAANHPESLADMTWVISKKQCELPVIGDGDGRVVSYPAFWQITAGAGRKMMLTCKVPPMAG